MICDDVCMLIRETPAAHGIFDAPTETPQRVFVQVRSVTRSEFYHAQQAGIEPAYVLRISEYADYNGEKIVFFRGKRWQVIRTYVDAQAIELTIGPAAADDAQERIPEPETEEVDANA